MPPSSDFSLPPEFKPPPEAVRCDDQPQPAADVEIARPTGGTVPPGPAANRLVIPRNAIQQERAHYRFGRAAGRYAVVRLGLAQGGDGFGPTRFNELVRVRISLRGYQPPDRDEVKLGLQKVEWQSGDPIADPEVDYPIAASGMQLNGANPWVEFTLDRCSAYIVVQI